MLAGRNGARGQIRTDTGDALDVVPLLVGLHEQIKRDCRLQVEDAFFCFSQTCPNTPP